MSIESEMKAWGRTTYRQFQQFYRENERGSELASSKRILNKVAPELAQPIADFMERFNKDGVSMPIWLCFIADLHPQIIAHVGLKTALDYIPTCNAYTRLSFNIGKEFENILRQRVAEETIAKNRLYDIKHTKSVKGKRMKFYQAEKNNRRFELWERRHKIALGAWLLGEIVNHTGLFEVRIERNGKKTIKLIYLSTEFKDWTRRFDHWKEIADPIRMALPHKPNDWTDYFNGGYETFNDPFVMNKPVKSHYNFNDLRKMYVSVNNVQRVPWCINHKVLEVAQHMWDTGQLMDYTEVPLQPYLENGLERPQELRAWKFKQNKIRRINESNRSKRLVHMKLLHLANKYKEWDSVYFPSRVDYRGRLYYMPAYLNPQGTDLAKGLLLFKNGQQVLDEDDLERLLVHGANCWGVKGSIEDRLYWIGKHQKWILETAEDPYDNDWWQEASEPFGFLAFCYEFKKFNDEGYGYVSHFPVRMDCSNNGMQILHLLLRDEGLAKHCNLVPDQPPGDMYQWVADLVYERLKDQSKESYIASQWFQHGVTRKLAKLAIMNKPYGQSYFHVLQKFLHEIGDNHPFRDGEQIDAINFLAEQFNTVAREVLVSVDRVHKFLRACAGGMGNKELSWTTPFGFKVIQKMTTHKRMLVRTIINNIQTQIKATEALDDIDPREQKNCITANFIHALDATVVHTLAYAMTYDMGFVHDCFISHACNARKVHQDVRKTYKNIYAIDLLKEFRCELITTNPTADLPDLPELGTLDVSQIDRAMYLLS